MSTNAPDSTGVYHHVETSPSGRYIRYKDVLGKGAYKTVYKAFDTEEALEVAWNKLHVDRLSEHDLEKVSNEVSLLRQVAHKNIIHFYDTWRGVDNNGNQSINFITEQMMSGTLKEYLRKAKAIKLKVIRRWSRNILEAIAYLHSRNPPIMHRDLKCDNIFINGHVGEVKIGDLGLSGVKEREKADSVIGTPEFMAPELYEESYTEKVDIYAFGMCLLEMVSMEYPYSECNNMAQIFKKVFSGEKPRAFEMLVDGDVKDVIAACLQREARRPSAVELLKHPLFQDWEQDVGTASNLSLVKGTPESAAASAEAAPSSAGLPIGMQVIDWSNELNRNVLVRTLQPDEGGAAEPGVEVGSSKENGGFFIWLEIPIRDAIKRVEFNFDPFADSAERIAQEMVAEFSLGTDQMHVIQEEIDRRVQIAKNQRAEATRNATPQPATRTVEASGEHTDHESNQTQVPSLSAATSVPMPTSTVPAPATVQAPMQDPVSEVQHVRVAPSQGSMSNVQHVQQIQQMQHVQQPVQPVQQPQHQVPQQVRQQAPQQVQQIPQQMPQQMQAVPQQAPQQVQVSQQAEQGSQQAPQHVQQVSQQVEQVPQQVQQVQEVQQVQQMQHVQQVHQAQQIQPARGLQTQGAVPELQHSQIRQEEGATPETQHAQTSIQQATEVTQLEVSPSAPQYVSPENDSHLSNQSVTSSGNLRRSRGNSGRGFSNILRQENASSVHSSREFGGIQSDETAPTAVETQRMAAEVALSSNYAAPSQPVSASVESSARIVTMSAPMESSAEVSAVSASVEPIARIVTVSAPMESAAPTIRPPVPQEVHAPPSVHSRQEVPSTASESSIGVRIRKSGSGRVNELVQQRIPADAHIHEAKIDPIVGSESVTRPQDGRGGGNFSSRSHTVDEGSFVPSNEGHVQLPPFSDSISDPATSDGRIGIDKNTLERQFPHSASDGHLPPPSSVTVVDIPPRPPSTPIAMSSGMDLTVEHHVASPTVAAVAYQGPENEPVQSFQSVQPVRVLRPQSPTGQRIETGNASATTYVRETVGNGHVQGATQRQLSASVLPIVVVGSPTKSGAAGTVRRSVNQFSAHSLPTYPSSETLTEPPYVSSSSNGMSVTSQNAQASVSYSSPQQGDAGPSTSTSSPQKSPPRKTGTLRTNSWKSLQSDDSGNNLAPRLPVGKLIGEEHDQKYYTMCLTLMDSCAKGQLQDVLKKLEDGANPNFSDYDKRTPLHLAAAEGHAPICSLLIENGAVVNRKDRWANTPLADAIESGHVEVQNLLKSHGAVDERRSSTDNINMELMRVAAHGDLEAVRAKIVAGADVRYADYDKRTPLHLACTEGHPEVAELLLVNGASPDARDRKGRSAVDDAVKNGHRNILRVLRQYGANIPRHLFEAQPELDNQKGMDLIEHAARGRVEAVRKALEQGASPNFADYDRRTALHLACVEGRLEVVRALLEAGASQNVVDRWGATPADEAKKGGFVNIVDELMMWESKRKQRQGSVVSFDHTAMVLNGHDRSPTARARVERESVHFDQFSNIATSVSLGAISQINLSADDFAAKYPSSASSTLRADGSSVSLPVTPFDRSDEFASTLESDERLLRQAYEAERLRLEERHRLAMEGLQRKKSAESMKPVRTPGDMSMSVSMPMSTVAPANLEARDTSEGVRDQSQRLMSDPSHVPMHGTFTHVPNGTEVPRQERSRVMVRQIPRPAVGSSGTSPVQVIHPPRYQAREGTMSGEIIPGRVNPEVRSIVDNLIDLAATRR